MDTDKQPQPTRIDLWLWAVRLFKTRSLAGEACRNSRVRVNGRISKPSRRIKAGDRVAVAQANDLVRELEVLSPISKRVGASIAIRCYEDHTSSEAIARAAEVASRNRSRPQRERGSGRPTKRQRRDIEKLMEESARQDEGLALFAKAARKKRKR